MNFSLLDQSKSSSDETDRITDEIDDTAARSYGCIFCKRGFTTAQALGGHMNIHRKDRNKTNPSSSSTSSSPVPPLIMSSDHELTYNYVTSVGQSHNNYQPPFYHPYAPEPYIGHPVSGRTSYYSFPAAQVEDHWLNRGVSDDRGLIWGQTLNLQGGGLRIGDDDHGGAAERDATVSGEDVDLELRLGYA